MGSPLPPPGDEASAVSRTLTARISAAISENAGCLPFDDFMAMALYEPGLGYYSAGARKFGKDGDFVTAPEISSLFLHHSSFGAAGLQLLLHNSCQVTVQVLGVRMDNSPPSSSSFSLAFLH